MKLSQIIKSKFKDQHGAVAVVVAIVIPVLIGFVALAVDVGYMFTTKNELQNVADSSALAATGLLGEIYTGMTYSQQQGYDITTDNQYDDAIFSTTYGTDKLSIEQMAYETAHENKAAGIGIEVFPGTGDVQIGKWDQNAVPPLSQFTVDPIQPNAVKIIARRDDTENLKIGTFFARIFGIDDVAVTAEAVAALTGQGSAGAGDLELPIGISEQWFELNKDEDGGYCGDLIQFSPSNDPTACAGWNTWDNSPSNDAKARKILNNLNGTDPDTDFDSPEMNVNEIDFDFINGDLSQNTFYALQTLFQIKGWDVTPNGDPACGIDEDGNPMIPCSGPDHWDAEIVGSDNQPNIQLDSKDDPDKYPDGTDRYEHRWQTTVVVYSGDCTPSGLQPIIGFVEIELQHVGDASDKVVYGIVKCDYVEGPSSGGGGSFGKFGSIPNLVR
jgi:hypothetical protein